MTPEEKREVGLSPASSMEVYGWQDQKEPFTENLPLHPASPYAVSKAAADMYVRMMGKVGELDYTILGRVIPMAGRVRPASWSSIWSLRC